MLPTRFLAIPLLTLFACAASANTGSLVRLEVNDLDGPGILQETYSARDGLAYVAGTPGHRYSVRLANLGSERILAVLAVDGVNAITGETASVDQAGYVLEPYQQVEVSGWRKSESDVASFLFTSPGDSYAGRTRRGQQIGILGVAVFREKPWPAVAAPSVAQEMAGSAGRADANGERRQASKAAANAPSIGTGHGERVWSPVVRTQFQRASRLPAERLAIGYDTRENLVARGILPATRPRLPDAFPLSPGEGYVPDPR